MIVLLVRRWRTIAIFTAAAAAAAITYAFLAPKWYEARLTVVPSQRSHDVAAMGLAAKLPSIGGLDSALSTDVQRIHAVLNSNSVADEVIKRFDLQDHYGTEHLEHTRKALWQHCTTSVDKKSGVVSLACEDQDPERAMTMAAYFGEVGNRVFGRVSASSAKEESAFLAGQVAKVRHDVDEASRKLREFQEKHKVVDLAEQSKAVISAMASLKGELLSKQLELSYLSSFSSSRESGVVQLRQQITIIEAKLAQLEASRSTRPAPGDAGPKDDKGGDFFPGAMNVPELRFELEQLFREQKIQETLFFLMTQRYEMAKVDEARDTSTFQILDHPTLPTYKSRPKRMKIGLVGLVAGLVCGTAWILVPIWWRRRTQSGHA